MPGPVGATTSPVGGTVISSSLFGIPVATDVINYVEKDWVDFSTTFQWFGSTTNPTKGNSVYSARYLWLHPKLINVKIHLVLGTTFAAGSGTYTFGVPLTAAEGAGYGALGTFHYLDSGSLNHQGAVSFLNNNTVQLIVDGSGSPLGSTGFSNLDDLRLDYSYQPL